MLICLCGGIGYAWSVFQNPIAAKFGWNASDVSLTFTLSIITSTLTPMLTGKFTRKLKTKTIVLIGGVILGTTVFSTGYLSSLMQLYLVYGIGAGMGIGLIYPVLMAYSIKLFPDKSGLSAGLLAASYGSGAMIWAPLAANITQGHGVLTAFKVLGAIFFVAVCSLSFLVGDITKDDIQDAQKHAHPEAVSSASIDKTTREMVRTPVFYVVLAMFVMGISSGIMLMGHASPILQSTLKLTPAKAAAIVGFLSLFNTCGRLFWGWALDRFGKYTVIFSLFILQGIAMVLLSTLSSYLPFVIVMLSVGLCYGGFATIIAPVTADMFGMKNLSSNYGLMYIAYGIAGVVGPMMASKLKELNNGSYSQAFLVAAVLGAAGFGMAIYIYIRSRKSEENTKLEIELQAQ